MAKVTNTSCKDQQDIYELFNCFVQKVIIEKKSMFDENEDEIFTKDNLKDLPNKFVNCNNIDEIKKEIENTDTPLSDNKKKIMQHIIWLAYLPLTDMNATSKYSKLGEYNFSFDGNFFPDGVAKYGQSITSIAKDIKYLINLFIKLANFKTKKTKIEDKLEDAKTQIKEKIYDLDNKDNNSHRSIRSMLLHLCDKKHYEPIASHNDKEAIVKNLYSHYIESVEIKNKKIVSFNNDNLKDFTLKNIKDEDFEVKTWANYKKNWKKNDLDEKLYILKQIINKVEGIEFDYIKQGVRNGFYHILILSKWKNDYVANGYEILTNYKKEIILYGAPGTGKTYSAMKIVEEFINEDENYEPITKEENNDDEAKDDIKINLEAYKFDYCYKKDSSEKNETTGKPKTECIKNISGITSNENYTIELNLSDIIKDKNNKIKDKNNKIKDKNNKVDPKVIWQVIQFNQSFSYEDFLEGLRPSNNNNLIVVDGVFKRFAQVAKQEQNKDKHFIFIIDEINRGKTDKIFGELLYLLEYRDKSVRLHYSGEDFSIPENVYIIGTMNTADKSIALLDVALRRRFWFVRCEPSIIVLKEKFNIYTYSDITQGDSPENVKKIALKLFEFLNGKEGGKENDKGAIEKALGEDANELKIGHSYFLKLVEKVKTDENGNLIGPKFSDLKNIWFYSIVPLLEEYCGFDKSKLSEMLSYKNNVDLSKMSDFTIDKLKS